MAKGTSKKPKAAPKAKAAEPKKDDAAKPAPANDQVNGAAVSGVAEPKGEARSAGEAGAGQASAATDPAPATPTAPPATAPAKEPPSELVVSIRGPRKGRWRCGRRFDREPTIIALEDLSEKEKASLVGDPKLSVEVLSSSEVEAPDT